VVRGCQAPEHSSEAWKGAEARLGCAERSCTSGLYSGSGLRPMFCRVSHVGEESYRGNGAIIVDCTRLWVVLQDLITKDNQTFSLTKITVAFDNSHNRLLLELER
jgi:hypothetical protein